MRLTLMLCMSFALFCASHVSAAAEPLAKTSVSLAGTWLLCQDQDHVQKDALQFFPEGYGFSLRREKPKVPFLYKFQMTTCCSPSTAETFSRCIYISTRTEPR